MFQFKFPVVSAAVILSHFLLYEIDRDEFQLGSLSHYLNSRAVGYMDLPAFAEVAPDPSVRNVEPPRPKVEPPVTFPVSVVR